MGRYSTDRCTDLEIIPWFYDPGLASIKHHFLLEPEIIFLNHGSFGATPESVFKEYQHWQPVEFLGRRITGLLAEARAALVEHLGTQADKIWFTHRT